MPYPIKTLAHLTGIRAHTLRIWEQRYTLTSPSRTATNIRRYTVDDACTLLQAALFNRWGYKVSNIERMSAVEKEEATKGLPPEAAADVYTTQLLCTMLRLDAVAFDKTFADIESSDGGGVLSVGVIYMLLQRTGWFEKCSFGEGAEERLAVQVVRRKLCTLLVGLPLPQAGGAPVVLLQPEHEFGDLPLLLVHHALRSAGVPSLYLGSNIPLADVAHYLEHQPAAALIIHSHSVSTRAQLMRYITTTHTRKPNLPLYVAGEAAVGIRRKLPAAVQVLSSIDNVEDLAKKWSQ